MALHSHRFVEEHDGFVGFGFDRSTDENTVRYYLQKFSDDALTSTLIPRLSDGELTEIFDLLNRMMKRHLSETEYHKLFLKEEHP